MTLIKTIIKVKFFHNNILELKKPANGKRYKKY